MKLTHYIYVLLPFLLAACDSEEVIRYVYTVGEADNEIKLSAGVVESGEQAQTRALADGTTPAYVAFTKGTQIALRVDGYWKGHGTDNWVRPTRSGTLGQADGTKNPITLSSPLYWDDYGTADPNNTDGTTSGRARGLTIYGAAVNGLTSLPTGAATDGGKLTPSDIPWGDKLAWKVGTANSSNIVDQSAGWANYDLLTSNNVKDDNTYKFADRTSGKLLEFTHAMTKVTVNLKAGKGFSDNQFQTAPKVTLLGFYYTGNVTITSKTSTATSESKANVNAHLANVKTTAEATAWTTAPTTWAASNQTQFDALVFPGNAFADATNILQIEADGNIYLVTAKAINDANTAENDPFEQAKNYVFDITVNKTGIENLEATITDWVSVTAANEAPKISVVTNYGDPTTSTGTPKIETFTKDYSFLRSENKADNSSNINKGYTDERWMKYATSAYIMYDATNGTTASPLYWPDHNTHYFFRGVYPRLGTSSSGDGVPVMSQITDNSVDYDVIAVSNEKYTHTDAGHSPSDLLIAYPHEYENTSDHYAKKCRHNQDVATNGICATEGKIVMNFEHAMAQVEVILQTNTAEGATNKVEFNSDTKVEIIGGYTAGYIRLKDGNAMFTGKSVTDYTMNRESTEGTDKDKKYLDAIIPQSLVDGDDKPTLKFRITVKSTNSSGDTNVDTYETVLGITEIALSDNSKITSWEHGKKYTYTLTITKTGIVAEATLKDWEEVTATQDVWF